MARLWKRKCDVMEKREGFLWGALAGGLVILYLLSSTDLIIKEREMEVYPVSIVIGDTTDDYYVNFRKGADQAADEYNVDVSFITLFDKGDAAQQIDLLRREIDDGAKAVILEPVNSAECARLLGERSLGIPVIAAGAMVASEPVKSWVSADYFKQGQKLGNAIAENSSGRLPVYVLTERLENGSTREMYDGLSSALSDAGYEVQVYEEEAEETFQTVLDSAVHPGSGRVIIAALDPASTRKAAEIIGESPVYGIYVAALYGTGTTPALLNQMDKGIIKGLTVSNEFEQGYLCVENAVKTIKRESIPQQILLESFYIEKEDLRDPSIEKMLYPIG